MPNVEWNNKNNMKIKGVALGCASACVVAMGCSAIAGVVDGVDPINTVWNAQKARAKALMPANAARVKADLAAAKLPEGKVAWYEVPAMSDIMRIGDTYPVDGTVGGTVGATFAQGEFEAASFELFAFEDLDGIELKVSDIKGPGGKLAADLRVVKCWFQNGNGWVSYFDDAGLKLVPELLLHDENLIEVDTEKAANYARVMKDGKATNVWISAPKGLDADAFDPFDPGFRDADSLLPVALEKNAFKQFFLTFHASKNQKPGVYRGTITIKQSNNPSNLAILSIPVAACVLPFELPMPRGYQNYDQLYVYACMGASPKLERLAERCKGDKARAENICRAWWQSLYDHSVFHATKASECSLDRVPMLRKIGFPLNPLWGDNGLPWFGLHLGGRMSFRNHMMVQHAAKKVGAFYDKHFPGVQVLSAYGDEQSAAFVSTFREAFECYLDTSVRMGCAGHDALMNKGGYIYRFYPMGGSPDEIEKARSWHEMGNEPVGFYASQHTGSENPQFVRMQHGLLGYLSGLTMTFNYEFATGSWNDRVNELYKPMVITYANGDGLMETIQYAGFREGCDDIRYATYLKGLCFEAEKKGPLAAKVAARKALQYLALLKRDKMDLNAVREEMIEYILKIREALEK